MSASADGLSAAAAAATSSDRANKSCFTLPTRTCDSNGLVTTSFAPAWAPRCWSNDSNVPASMMMGTDRNTGSVRSAAHTS